jgi:hypothetical protein
MQKAQTTLMRGAGDTVTRSSMMATAKLMWQVYIFMSILLFVDRISAVRGAAGCLSETAAAQIRSDSAAN